MRSQNDIVHDQHANVINLVIQIECPTSRSQREVPHLHFQQVQSSVQPFPEADVASDHQVGLTTAGLLVIQPGNFLTANLLAGQ